MGFNSAFKGLKVTFWRVGVAIFLAMETQQEASNICSSSICQT
jgi:hypothetical protein